MTTAPNSYTHLITQKTTTHSDAPTVLYAGVLLSRAQDRGIREKNKKSICAHRHRMCMRVALEPPPP